MPRLGRDLFQAAFLCYAFGSSLRLSFRSPNNAQVLASQVLDGQGELENSENGSLLRSPPNATLVPNVTETGSDSAFNTTTLLTRGQWPTEARFTEYISTPHVSTPLWSPPGRFRIDFSNLGPVSGQEQNTMVYRALQEFSYAERLEPQWPQSFNWRWPRPDPVVIPHPWVEIAISFNDAELPSNAKVATQLLRLLVPILRGRKTRDMTLKASYEVEQRGWVPLADFRMHILPPPDGPQTQRPAGPFSRSIVHGRRSADYLTFLEGDIPVNGPRYGRLEMLQQLRREKMSIHSKNRDQMVLPQDLPHVDLPYTGWKLHISSHRHDFTYGLLNDILETLTDVVVRYGMFAARVIIRVDYIQWGEIQF